MEDKQEMVTLTITKEQFESIKRLGHGVFQDCKRWFDTRKWDDPDDGTELYQQRLAHNRKVMEQAEWLVRELKPN